jgi:hypothetical protein
MFCCGGGGATAAGWGAMDMPALGGPLPGAEGGCPDMVASYSSCCHLSNSESPPEAFLHALYPDPFQGRSGKDECKK